MRAEAPTKKAIVAVAASILTAAYHMIKTGTFYQDLCADHFERRAKPTQIATLQGLGYELETSRWLRDQLPVSG